MQKNGTGDTGGDGVRAGNGTTVYLTDCDVGTYDKACSWACLSVVAGNGGTATFISENCNFYAYASNPYEFIFEGYSGNAYFRTINDYYGRCRSATIVSNNGGDGQYGYAYYSKSATGSWDGPIASYKNFTNRSTPNTH